MAPEVVSGSSGSTHELHLADVWSLGCAVIEMATGRPLWHDDSNNATLMIKIASADAFKQAKQRLKGRLSKAGEDFVRCCLTRDIASRPSARDLLRHEFFAGVVLPPSCLASLTELAASRIGLTGAGPLPGDKTASLVLRAFSTLRMQRATQSKGESAVSTVVAAAGAVQYRRQVETGRRRLTRFLGLPLRARRRAVAAALAAAAPWTADSREHAPGRRAIDESGLESSGDTEGLSVSTMLSAGTVRQGGSLGVDLFQCRAPTIAECARACARAEQHLLHVAEACSSGLWSLREWWSHWENADNTDETQARTETLRDGSDGSSV